MTYQKERRENSVQVNQRTVEKQIVSFILTLKIVKICDCTTFFYSKGVDVGVGIGQRGRLFTFMGESCWSTWRDGTYWE